MTINELVQDSTDTARDKGWLKDGRSFGDHISLIHSELSEALEEFRAGLPLNEIYYTDLCSCRGPEQACSNCGKVPKPEGIPIELADVVIRIAMFCGQEGIDLQGALEIKAAYNATRSFRHGRKEL